ncbi:hypothetical protein IV203_022994 [Nitzschia inconspicua]|uniref:F-box domain-containing protein n=1 Tax=Nitzschia inconspicua TaxID=303405 RepID=A0A9K3KDP7_9STRA|nr:hypothetical protein IV203_022994 [Nitzschia inconspicua]
MSSATPNNKRRRQISNVTADLHLNSLTDTVRNILTQQFLEKQDLMVHVLSFFPVATLLQHKCVSKEWNHLCTIAIDAKVGDHGPKPFETKKELKNGPFPIIYETHANTRKRLPERMDIPSASGMYPRSRIFLFSLMNKMVSMNASKTGTQAMQQQWLLCLGMQRTLTEIFLHGMCRT